MKYTRLIRKVNASVTKPFQGLLRQVQKYDSKKKKWTHINTLFT